MRVVFLLILFNVSTAFGTPEFVFKPDQGHVTYKTRGWPNLVVIEAKGKGVEGKLTEDKNKVSGELVFKLATFDSGMKSRDDHALKYLEAKKFPKAKIKFTQLEPPKDYNGSFNFTGMVTLHGVEKPISGKAVLNKKDSDLNLSGEFILNFKDFNVNVPAWNGITVAEKVEVKFETQVSIVR